MGMRQGERRLLYIHPSLGFRSMHWTVPPSVVLIIDVEFDKGLDVGENGVKPNYERLSRCSKAY